MNRILVVGFQRSGTTMLRRLLESHPEVDKMFHETHLMKNALNRRMLKKNQIAKITIKRPKGRQEKYIPNLDKAWGEKIPYFKSNAGAYCDLWRDVFKSNHSVIHIIRNPYDVASSNKRKFNLGYTSTLKAYEKHMFGLLKMKQCMVIKYEYLLQNIDEAIPLILDYCKLSTDCIDDVLNTKFRYFEGLEPSRANAYLESGEFDENPLATKLLEHYNNIKDCYTR